MAGLFVLSAIAAAACSFLLDTSGDQCKTDDDCKARGAAFAGMQCVNRVCVTADAGSEDAAADAGGPWGCLGSVVFPVPPKNDVHVVVPLVDLTTQQPITAADVFARVCAKIDVNCNNPLSSGDAGIILSPDANGLLHLTFPAGFDGFVLIDPVIPTSDAGAPDGGSDAGPPNVVVPSLVFFNPPIDKDLTYATIVMVHLSELGQIAQIEGTALDPGLGAVFMENVDCTIKAAAGVSVSLDSTGSTTQGFYFENGLPKLNAPATDLTGYAGFVNAPLGTRTVTGKVEASQQRIGTATVFTRPSMISYTVLAPSP